MAPQGSEDMAGLINFLKTYFNHAKFQLWSLWAAGPIILVYVVALTLAILFLPWPELLAAKRLDFIGFALLGALTIVGLTIFFMAGVVKSIRVKAGPAELEIEGDDDDEPNVPGDDAGKD